MKALGYWHSDADPELPDPRDFVCRGWLGEERLELIRYLKSGAIFQGAWGHSWCRFTCGIADIEMGSRDLTDGDWVWPEGLSHYVEFHDVMLPEHFIAHCRSRDWHIAELPGIRRSKPDDSIWREWATKIKTQGEQVMDVNRP